MPFINSLEWSEAGATHRANWLSPNQTKVPTRIVLADDNLSADAAQREISQGASLLWRGDYHQARQLLQALARRLDKHPTKPGPLPQAFHQWRMQQAQRARTLGSVLVEVDAHWRIQARRAPDLLEAMQSAFPEWQTALPGLISLRDLQGIVGAWEWRKNGLALSQLDGARLTPHWGVFAPQRHEYLDLLLQAELPPSCSHALDFGCGSGILSLLLAKRGVAQIDASDNAPRAIACAQENLHALMPTGVTWRVVDIEGFAEDRTYDLMVCNPPWLPGKTNSSMEAAIYDPDSRMLRTYLAEARTHLQPDGQAWLILSDLAEHLSLRSRAELEAWIAQGGLRVIEKLDIPPRHKRDPHDPFYAQRMQEVTSLWRLGR